jgi:hypothetical protein
MRWGDRGTADGVLDGGCSGAHFGESDVAAGGCRFLRLHPGTIWSCESLREPAPFARIFFGAAPAEWYVRTGYRRRCSPICIPYCIFRGAIGLVLRSRTAA